MPSDPSASPRSACHVLLAAAAIGFSTLAVQIAFLRECLSVLCGNELVIGIILAEWMLFTGLGAEAGIRLTHKHCSPWFPGVLLIALALLPIIGVTAMRMLRNTVFLPGSMIGIAGAGLVSAGVLLPFCIAAGIAFSTIVALTEKRSGEHALTTVYALESIGGAVGGVVCSLFVVAFLDTFDILVTVTVVCLLAASVFSHREKIPTLRWICGGLLLAGVPLLFLTGIDTLTKECLFPGQTLLFAKDTPYGSIATTRSNGQTNIYENTMLLTSTNDVTTAEEGVHYALVQVPSPRRVLLIGGGTNGLLNEVLKYGVEEVDYVEVDPWLMKIAAQYSFLPADPRIHLITDDARLFIEHAAQRYDAVLMNLPDPSTAQLNRFYTIEFLRNVKAILSPGGIVQHCLLPGTEYQGGASRRLGASLYNTMKAVFPTVLIVPGARYFFLGSDHALDIHITQMIAARGIPTLYVNQYYLDDAMLVERSRTLEASFDCDEPVDTDFRPTTYSRQLDYWLSYYGTNVRWALAPVVLLGLLLFVRTDAVGAGVYATGMGTASVQTVLLLAFQSLCGSVYSMAGLVVTFFMIGLAVGAGPVFRHIRQGGKTIFTATQCTGAALSIIMIPGLMLAAHSGLSLTALRAVFGIAALAVGLTGGLTFALGAAIRRKEAGSTPSSLYSLDLGGAAVGAFMTSVWFIPAWGLRWSLFVAAVVMAAGAARSLVLGRAQEPAATRPSA